MRFELDDELHDFARVVESVLAKTAGASGVRPYWDNPELVNPPTLEALATTGLMALAAPESIGGSGLALSDLVGVVELLGEWIVPEPIAETTSVVVPMLTPHLENGAVNGLLRAIVAGEGFATIQPSVTGWAPWASTSIAAMISEGEDVRVVDPRGHVENIEGVDPSLRIGRVLPEAPELFRITGAARSLEQHAAMASALQLFGVSRAMLNQAVAYSLERKQFGRQIGSYQALKHQMADVFVDIENSRRSAWWAAWCLATDDANTDEAVSLAKALAGDAARIASRVALQVHGGIGYTWDADLHLWMKRSMILSGAWGATDDHWNALHELYVAEIDQLAEVVS